MSDGTELTPAPESLDITKEVQQETREVTEAKQDLDRATIEPAAQLEKVGDVKQSEDLEKEVVAALETAPKLENPPAITLEGAGAEGKVTIERAAEAAADGGRMTEDREVGAANTAADRGPETEDRVEAAADETVMIDTVPLPETPIATTEIDGREAIGTWPTPEVPAAAVTGAQDLAGVETEEQADQSEDQVRDSTPASEPGSSLRSPDSEDLDSHLSNAPRGNFSTAQTVSQKASSTIAAGESEGTTVTTDSETDTEESSAGGSDPVSEVAAVSEMSGETEEFTADMESAQSGELRGFEESDGNPDYTFTGDAISSSSEFADRLTGGEIAREVTQDTVSASPPLEDETGNQSSSSVNTINGVTISEASVEVEPHNIPDSSEQTSDPSETAEEYSEQLAQYEKELELQQEDLVDLINSLRAELEEINELGEELADKRANMPEPPSQEDYLSEDGSLDEENYSWALKQYSEDKHAFEEEIETLLQRIAIKQDIITNLEGQITDKRAEIDKTQKKINKLLGIISNLQKKTNETQDSPIQNIK
jgi:uncharacterized coiled-coil protein SlyX